MKQWCQPRSAHPALGHEVEVAAIADLAHEDIGRHANDAFVLIFKEQLDAELPAYSPLVLSRRSVDQVVELHAPVSQVSEGGNAVGRIAKCQYDNAMPGRAQRGRDRSEEHTSELQS